MKTPLLLSALLLAAPAFAGEDHAHFPPAPTNPAFEAIKKLAGEWTGKSGDVRYELVSGGTAVMESISMGKDGGSMVTMYTPEGDGVLMTHYCAMGNQPRMKAGPADPRTGAIVFKFLDAANVRSKDEPVMNGLTLKAAGDKLTADWTSKTGEKVEHSVFELTRKKKA
jgi:hypothetical protein